MIKLSLLKKLDWYHWLVVGLSLLLTLSAWYIAKQQAEQKSFNQFDFQSKQIIELVKERMAKYEEALWAGVAALQVLPPSATRQQWHTFATSLEIEKRFPGINGIGVIHYVPPNKLNEYLNWQRQSLSEYGIHPPHEQSEYWPITYIEPEEMNLKAVGLDMAHETTRYQAAVKARNGQQATITGPITLVQDSKNTPGFLFFVPWFSNSQSSPYYGDADTQFAGLVYAPFIVNKLMSGTLNNANRQVNFNIYDGSTPLYIELTESSQDYDPTPMYSAIHKLNFYGRTWVFDIHSSALFEEQQEQSQPLLILAGGLIIDALLIALFITLTRTKKKATEYAEKATRELRARQQELELTHQQLAVRNVKLEEANKELDQFAFVASHDLKAPLRGIAQLAEWIDADAQDQLTAQPREYLDLLRQRTERLERLLDDLLAYSRVGKKGNEINSIQLKPFVEEIFALQNAPSSITLDVKDHIGSMETLATPLEQVLRNLIANAIKHHDKDTGTITVIASKQAKHYEFQVSDDGPGIPPRYQNKVFELFHTLKPRDEVEGSGLGLSIIKKILDKYECQYRLESDGESGTTFTFTWPFDNWFSKFEN